MMKNLSLIIFTAFVVMATSFEAEAQRRGNRNGNGGVRNNPSRQRPVTRPNRPTARPDRRTRNPRTTNGYNTRRPDRRTMNPRRTSGYNRPRPANINRNHVARRYRTTYRSYTHSPYRHNYVARRQYLRTVNYYNYLRSMSYNYFYRNWIFYPASYMNGYRVLNGYPYFIYAGYAHRYSYNDICDYQLVDSYTDSVVQSYSNMSCAYAYDSCADDRDYENRYEMDDRYFCAERY